MPVLPIQSIENGREQHNDAGIDTDSQQICSDTSRSIAAPRETLGRV
ncbi:MAG: hypothetical protein KFB97_06230 [Cyanobium sp. M30B3]|nr:MAG: hypothetical protein KFB97_06230 [Cyanobium sp. M30B3]